MNDTKPLVAVVGRPNVGKSTFFNKICGKKISIVKNTPGVTRDRVYADAEWCGYNFTLIDTGGLDFSGKDGMIDNIRKQAETAINTCDLILFFVDAKDGVLPPDYDIAEILRDSKKPVLLVVNKLDNFEMELVYDFYALGMGEPFPISCEQSKGLGDLLDEIVKHFKDRNENVVTPDLKIAIVGKPNVGKSSLVNKILGYDRVIVSDVAGTTRDAIDTPFVYNGRRYSIIDTAGMRRKRSIDDETVESYSIMRTLNAIQRADVALVMMDSSEQISEQDVRIAGIIHESYKPGIIVLNKWDLVEKDTYTVEEYINRLNIDLAFMSYFKSVFISALTGLRINKIMPLIEQVYENNSRRISTGAVNDVIFEAVMMNEPSTQSGKRLKFLFSTQAETNPPTFVLFVNDATLVHENYKRYLTNALRKAFDFSGTPIKLIFRSRKEDEDTRR